MRSRAVSGSDWSRRGGTRDEGKDGFSFDFSWMDAQVFDPGGGTLRGDGAGGQRPDFPSSQMPGSEGKTLTHADAVDLFCWVAGEPAEDMGIQPGFAEDIPKGFGLPGGA